MKKIALRKTSRLSAITSLMAFTFPLSLLTFTSCDKNDEDFVPQDNLKDTPITVTAGVAELSTRAGYETTEITSVLPETFHLSVDQMGENYDYSNMLMTKTAGNTYTPETTMLWAGGNNNEVTATAATFSLTEVQTLGAKTDQSTADSVKASDHLYMASTSVTPSVDGIPVEFDHIMSKVVLTITLGDEFASEENPFSGVTFMGTVASNSYTAGTGWATIADDATATDIVPFLNAYAAPTTAKPNATAEYEAILVPQTIAAGKFVVLFNVGDRMFKWTSKDAVTLESGYKYTLALTAGKDKVSGANFTAKAWNTGEDNGNNLSGETE